MSGTVYLDLTRMLRRARFAAPTGIDRWDLAVAERLLLDRALPAAAVVQSGGRLRRLPDGVARHAVTVIGAVWRGAAPKGWPSALVSLARAARLPHGPGVYLNLSHQGLDDPRLWRAAASEGLRAAVYLHDLIPLHIPATTRPGQPERHRARLLQSLAHAAMLFCPSRAVAADFAGFAGTEGIPLPPVHLLPPGIDALPRPAPLWLGHPHVVMLGTLEPRKGHDVLPAIWGGWPDPGARPELLVIGQDGWQGPAIRSRLVAAPELAGRLRFLPSARDDEVRSALAGAVALLMPSLAEGWGMPVGEALALGTPALCRDLPVWAESAQGLATLLPAPERDPAAWTGAIDALIRQPQRVSGYRARTWDDALSALEAALGGLL